MEETKEKFLALQTREDVANLLGIKEKSLRYFLYVVKPDNMYHEFEVPKKSGGKRTICAPDKRLKNIQRKLANILNCVYKTKPAAHGFVKDKDIVSNAKNHVRRRYVLNLDLENFFEQINFGRVRGMLMKPPYGIGEEAATVIAQIACYKGKLPQGAPSSPILTNMICSPMDTQLTRAAMKYKLRYSRYADDITFSSFKEEIPQAIVCILDSGVKVGKEVVDIIERNGFSVNAGKTRLFSYNNRQEVTGLVVNRFVNIPREYIKEIRAMLNHCRKSGIYAAAKEYIQKGKCKNAKIELLINDETEENITKVEEWFVQVLRGRIGYIRYVKGRSHLVFIKYAKELNNLCGEEIFHIESEIQLLDIIEKSVFILEASTGESLSQGSGFILKNVGLLTNYHVTEDGEQYKVTTYKGDLKCCVSNDINLIKRDMKIDYACYTFGSQSEDAFEIGTSQDLQIGGRVTMIGYPDYVNGNSPDVQDVRITGIRKFMEQSIYTVSGRVIHGSSGGVVIDKNYKVVGIIRCGTKSFDESENTVVHGFIPIDDVISDLNRE